MNDSHEPDEKMLTDAVRRQLEADNREAAADDSPMGPVGNVPSRRESDQRAAEGGLTEAARPGQGPTADDATPETLMPEDGSRSPAEANISDSAADTELTEVGGGAIGGGRGLDEAELGRARPLDGRPWDGDPDEPLEPATAVDESLVTPAPDEPDSG